MASWLVAKLPGVEMTGKRLIDFVFGIHMRSHASNTIQV